MERTIHKKDARVGSQENPLAQIVRGHMLFHIEGVQNTKKQAFRQHVVSNQKSYASVLSPKHSPAAQTFTFNADQLTKFVASVVIQIAQPKVCYPNPKQDTLDLKSSMCRKVSQAAKNILKFDFTAKDLLESIGPLSSPHPKPFTFASNKVNCTSKPTSKPLIIKSTSPSNSTKAVPKQSKTTK